MALTARQFQRPARVMLAAERAKAEAEPGDLLSQHLNDSGNAARLITFAGEDLRYCSAFKRWLVWDGWRWMLDDNGQALRRAKHTMLAFYSQAVNTGDDRMEKFANRSLDATRLRAMVQLAECEIYIGPDDLDQHPFLLNFKNGTVDLRTGELRPHQRTDFLTKLVHHNYCPEASCDRWMEFLERIMGGGPDASEGDADRAQRLMDYLQRAFGYSLTGTTIEKAVFVLFGSGNNGKSTMLSTFRQLIEEYSQLLQVDSLMSRSDSNNNAQADLADLRGARFVQTSESEEGQRLSQGKLKRITQGMGKIKAVRKYENPIEFPETHKLWIDTNRKPTISDVDDQATFNRLHPIPFTVSIPSKEIDRDLPAKLLGEAEGILAWAVEGARVYSAGAPGLTKPPEIMAANDDWRSENDHLGRFIEERCVVGDSFSCMASHLYNAYKAWALESGEREMSATAFGRRLPNRGFEKRAARAGNRYERIAVRANDSGE